MIHAIDMGKIDRSHCNNEDSLTSFIFERLSYLPIELFKEIISKLTNCKSDKFGNFKEMQFWPHWNSKCTNNENFVEPDVFIRFSEVDVIIEAKRYDGTQQYEGQWKNEIVGYINEYEQEYNKEKLLFVALGDSKNNEKEIEIKKGNEKYSGKYCIYRRKWSLILHEIELLKDKNTNDYGINNVLNDTILIFQKFGFFVGEWFKTLDFKEKIADDANKWFINNPINGKKG